MVVFLDIFGAVTRMEEAQRTQASRRGHRAHLTKLLKKTDDIMTKESSSEMDMATLQKYYRTVRKEKSNIKRTGCEDYHLD